MATENLIARINALAKKAKTEGLTEAEQAEQQQLRAEYVKSFRANLKEQLDSTIIQRPDGSQERLGDKGTK